MEAASGHFSSILAIFAHEEKKAQNNKMNDKQMKRSSSNLTETMKRTSTTISKTTAQIRPSTGLHFCFIVMYEGTPEETQDIRNQGSANLL